MRCTQQSLPNLHHSQLPEGYSTVVMRIAKPHRDSISTMKPHDIFTVRGYDMVVAVTFDAINREIRKLSEAEDKFHT